MTKVQAIIKVMEKNGGTATLRQIYAETGFYYNGIKSANWKAGLRGVLYREIRNGRTFRKTGNATYAYISSITALECFDKAELDRLIDRGIQLSRSTSWSGAEILAIAQAALTDANFHKQAALLAKITL